MVKALSGPEVPEPVDRSLGGIDVRPRWAGQGAGPPPRRAGLKPRWRQLDRTMTTPLCEESFLAPAQAADGCPFRLLSCSIPPAIHTQGGSFSMVKAEGACAMGRSPA